MCVVWCLAVWCWAGKTVTKTQTRRKERTLPTCSKPNVFSCSVFSQRICRTCSLTMYTVFSYYVQRVLKLRVGCGAGRTWLAVPVLLGGGWRQLSDISRLFNIRASCPRPPRSLSAHLPACVESRVCACVHACVCARADTCVIHV